MKMAAKCKLLTTTEVLKLFNGLQSESEIDSNDDDDYQETVLLESDEEILLTNSNVQRFVNDDEVPVLSRQTELAFGEDKSEMECSGGHENVQEPQPPLISIMGDVVVPFGSSDSELDQSVLHYNVTLILRGINTLN